MASKNKKGLGQHWLRERGVLTEIAESAATPGVDTVLEIGPGLGTLTSALFLYFDKVVAIEFDAELARKLPGSFPGKNLEAIHGDILDAVIELGNQNLPTSIAMPDKYVVAGNIPYYITAPIVRKFLTLEHKPAKMVLLVQKEVAERLVAREPDYSILGLSAQIYADVRLGPVVGREKFSPPPKVDSQVVIFEPYAKPLADEQVMRVVRLGFSSPRKKLKNNLGLKDGVLSGVGMDEGVRPADLTILQWKSLAEYLHKR